MKLKINPDALKSSYLKPYKGLPLKWFANKGSIFDDGQVLMDDTSLDLSHITQVDFHFFLQKTHIHNETAFGNIHSLECKPGTLEMLISVIPDIKERSEIISRNGKVAKVVCCLGTFMKDPRYGMVGIAWKPETDEIIKVNLMTPWDNPWNSEEVCYLTYQPIITS